MTWSGLDGIAALTRLGQSLSGAILSDAVIARTADVIRDILRPDSLLIVMARPGAGRREVAYASFSHAEADDPLVDLVFKKGRQFFPDNVGTRAADEGIQLLATPGSWMGLPIQAAHHTIGVVSIGSDTPARYQDHDLRLLDAVIAQSAIALVNAMMVEQLSAAKREWEDTVDAIPQAFCIIDARGNINRANRAFASLVQVSVTSISGRPWLSVIPESWSDAVSRALATAERGASCELKDGQRLFAVTAHPVGDHQSGTSVLVLEDQTDKRTLQDQLVQSAKMSAIGQLIAGVAHDLNNPLASVVGFAEYLAEAKDDTPARLIEPLRAIHQEAERAAKIVKSLLAFARKQDSERHAHAIGPILESTLLLQRNQLMAHQVEVSVHASDDLPSVTANANQLQQVFVNLINNAAQAIYSTGVGGRIVVRAEPWLDGVAVTVEDDGPGVPPDIGDQVFEPFFTTKPEGKGTGLGLSICHGIITEHGGRIQRLERDQPGAAFRVELPGGGPIQAAPIEPTPAPEALRVLVVDDEPHIRHYMRATLEAWGHTVVAAPDGGVALDLVGQESFDLIISDLRMPKVSGRDFFNALQDAHPTVAERLVFTTGDTVGGDTLTFLESLSRPHLKKPFSLAELRSILASAGRRATG